jgi:hypothetical protein
VALAPAPVQLQRCGAETFIGYLADGQRHGLGLLATERGQSLLLYLGEFRHGQQDGFGIVLSAGSGHAFQGCVQGGVLWGPGIALYSTPRAGGAGATAGAGAPQPVRWEGMMNGRPAGRGVLTFSDGAQVRPPACLAAAAAAAPADRPLCAPAVDQSDCPAVLKTPRSAAEGAWRLPGAGVRAV